MEIRKKYFRRDFLYTGDDDLEHRNVIYYRVINDLHRGGINTEFGEISKSEGYCTAPLDLDDDNTERECTPLEIEWIEHCLENELYVDFHKFKIEEAQRRYPIGTHFLYAHFNDISNDKNIGIIVSDNFKLVDNNIYNLTTDGETYNTNELPGHSLTGDCYNRLVYCDDKWAEIIQKDNKYVVGDYIVCLNTPVGVNSMNGYRTDGGVGFIPNMCLKVTKIDNYDNYQILWYENEACGIFSNSVRLATPTEIEKYNKIGKYDITDSKLNTDKKYKISELIERSEHIIVFINSIEEHYILKTYDELNICDYHGAYYYSLSDCDYSSSSCKTDSGAYDRDKTMVLFEKIDFDISNEENKLLNKAKRDYPIGTYFIPTHLSKSYNSVCKVVNDSFDISENCIYSLTEEGDTWDNKKRKSHSPTGNNYSRCIFDENNLKKIYWAEILSLEEVRELERNNGQKIEEVKEPEKSKVYHAVQVYSEKEHNLVLDILKSKVYDTRFKGPGSCISLITDDNFGVLKGYVESSDVYYTYRNLNIIQFQDWIKQGYHLEPPLIRTTGITGSCIKDPTHNLSELHNFKKDEKLQLLLFSENPDKMVKIVPINVIKVLNIED